MKRSELMLEKRKQFVLNYISSQENQNKPLKAVIYELSERLFVSERTVYGIIKSA